MNGYDDIYRMHSQHGLTIRSKPALLTASEQRFREEFLREELLEFELACRGKDLPEAADALIDLVVVAMGTAVMMGLPWHALWADVLRANMSKVRGSSERAQGEAQDLIKPEGWVAPQSTGILDEYKDGTPPPPYSEMKIMTLCGSFKFKEEFEHWNRFYTLRGWTVFSISTLADSHVSTATLKETLAQIHRHKIRMSGTIFVINPGSIIESSTREEIEYARSLDLEILSMEPI
tara:strand:+ start:365 stop:1066 length:702 start_codon:yes stop_codon:yes gene_type:complete